jgi:hypothetical protein
MIDQAIIDQVLVSNPSSKDFEFRLHPRYADRHYFRRDDQYLSDGEDGEASEIPQGDQFLSVSSYAMFDMDNSYYDSMIFQPAKRPRDDDD